jgi:glycosyltransferase involved in cell wall biosynthesis
MIDRPQFSIATPTRNALNHLKRCVGSIRGQSGVTHEHLLQDATSTDGTAEWLAVQSDLSLVSERDSGMYDAINHAWARSRGGILSWLNSDEQYLPGTLARVAAVFDSDPLLEVVWGDAIIVDSRGKPIALRREIPFRSAYIANNFLYVMSCATFFRRSLFDRGLLKFDTQYRYSGDMDLFLRIARSGAIIRHVPAYLSLFGNHGGNLSNDSSGVGDELERVRRAHGAFGNPALRKLVLVGRRVERVVGGAYAKKDITYRFAIDEKPNYLEVSAKGVGGRYSLRDIEGLPSEVRAIIGH